MWKSWKAAAIKNKTVMGSKASSKIKHEKNMRELGFSPRKMQGVGCNDWFVERT